jgi:hypothetical protein
MAATHRCAARGCSTFIPLKLLMCGKHWRALPRAIQRRVNAAWNAGDTTDDYGPAVVDALASLELQHSLFQ